MPIVEHQGAKLYWDEQGEGEPLLLIMGLGSSSRLWERIRPALAAHFRTLTLDNRGIARSECSPESISMPQMAADGIAVLDAAGVDRAHVFGTSMGGMIAQELTLNYPQRVRSLILGCTMPGGPNAVRAPRPSIEGLTPEQAEAALNAITYHPSTSKALIDEDRVLCGVPSAAIYQAQIESIMKWECYSRLPQITAPTLIIHGDADQRIPNANGPLIASRIPGAKFVSIPNAGHVFITDQPEASARIALEFLLKSPDRPAAESYAQADVVS